MSDSRTRRESAAFAVDFAAMADAQGARPAPSGTPAATATSFGVGFSGGRMTWRASIPAAQIVHLERL